LRYILYFKSTQFVVSLQTEFKVLLDCCLNIVIKHLVVVVVVVVIVVVVVVLLLRKVISSEKAFPRFSIF